MNSNFIERIGEKTIDFFFALFGGFKIIFLSLFYLFVPSSYKEDARKNSVKQIYYTALEPLGIFLLLAALFGTALLGALISLAISFNLQDKIGLLIIKFSIVEFAPFFTAFFIALYSSPTVYAALIEKNKIDLNAHEIALDTFMASLVPRVIAGMLSALSLGSLVILLLLFSSYVFLLFYLGMDFNNYLITLKNAVHPNDLILFIIKSIVFGFLAFFFPVYYALMNNKILRFAEHKLLQTILKLLLALFFIEVLSLVLQSL